MIWNGDVKANVSTSFSLTIRASEVGRLNVAATADYCLTNGVWSKWYGDTNGLGIYVAEDKISIVPGGFVYDYVYRGICPESKIYLQPASIVWTYPEQEINGTFTVEVRVTNIEDLSITTCPRVGPDCLGVD